MYSILEGGKSMKQIDAFVDSIYRNVGGNKKEIQEIKSRNEKSSVRGNS